MDRINFDGLPETWRWLVDENDALRKRVKELVSTIRSKADLAQLLLRCTEAEEKRNALWHENARLKARLERLEEGNKP